MHDDSYLMVQWRHDGYWFAGRDPHGAAKWRKDRAKGLTFDCQCAFRRYFRQIFCAPLSEWWDKHDIRFVRVRPRKEGA
jgi:hypothetical protein